MSEQVTLPALPVQDGVEFRHVEDFPGYCVGTDGSVWSCLNNRWGFLDAWERLQLVELSDGYLKVTLCARGRHCQRRVHQLVLSAFVGLCPAGKECLHQDGDRKNNQLDNIRWGTRVENAADTRRHGRHFTPFAKPSKLSAEVQAEIRRRHLDGRSIRKIASGIGVSKSTVWAVIARKGVYQESESGLPNL